MARAYFMAHAYKEAMSLRTPLSRLRTAGLAVALCLGAAAHAQDDSWKQALGNPRELLAELREEVVSIPLHAATAQEQAFPLTGTLFQPAGPGPFPVVVLSHGSPARARDRDVMGRYRVIPQVREFMRMGFAVLVPMRRGYGASPGDYAESFGPCSEGARFEQSGAASARDVISAIDFVRTRPSLDARRIVLAGQSAAGFASLAAAAQAPAGVVAVINLAGGRGGRGRDGVPCAPEAMASVLARYAATTRAPVLWLYAENDKYFGPATSRAWHAAFERAGGKGRYLLTPAFGNDGHLLFYAAEGIPVWSPPVQAFLREAGL
jgi:dienelactone hydrolase